MTAEQITTIVVALLGGGFLTALVQWLAPLIKGRGTRRSELEQAHARADLEATKRRIVEEHASRLTRQLLEAPCVDSSSIPPFPPYPKKETP